MGRPEYPRDIREFRQKFATQEACTEYLIRGRWPEGVVCPKCSGKASTLLRTRLLFCVESVGTNHLPRLVPSCTAPISLSDLPLREWFWAAYLVATPTPGISAAQLQRQLGISSDTTAWHLLHRLRKGMVNETRSPLSGLIEADESLIGGPAKGNEAGVLRLPHTRA